jgi:hypothetical protein
MVEELILAPHVAMTRRWICRASDDKFGAVHGMGCMTDHYDPCGGS